MSRWPHLLAAVVSCVGPAVGLAAAGCSDGHSTRRSGHSARSSAAPVAPVPPAAHATIHDTPPGSYARGDDDTDDDDNGREYQRDDYPVRRYGHQAQDAPRHAVARLVRRYFHAAAAGNGAKACSLLSSRLAGRRDLSAAVPADYASPLTAALRGEKCARFMTNLLRLSKRQIAAAKVSTMVVTGVRTHGSVALALLGFRIAKERYIPVRREGETWRIDALLDLPIP